jgi:hypothetical protein
MNEMRNEYKMLAGYAKEIDHSGNLGVDGDNIDVKFEI